MSPKVHPEDGDGEDQSAFCAKKVCGPIRVKHLLPLALGIGVFGVTVWRLKLVGAICPHTTEEDCKADERPGGCFWVMHSKICQDWDPGCRQWSVLGAPEGVMPCLSSGCAWCDRTCSVHDPSQCYWCKKWSALNETCILETALFSAADDAHRIRRLRAREFRGGRRSLGGGDEEEEEGGPDTTCLEFALEHHRQLNQPAGDQRRLGGGGGGVSDGGGSWWEEPSQCIGPVDGEGMLVDDGDDDGGSFAAGTLVEMHDGSWMPVELVRIGDRVRLGGRVTARMEFLASRKELFLYTPPPPPTPPPLPAQPAGVADFSSSQPSVASGATTAAAAMALPGDAEQTPGGGTPPVVVAGGHAVLEQGVWRRVREAMGSRPVDVETWRKMLVAPSGGGPKSARVFDLDVERHQLSIRGAAAVAGAERRPAREGMLPPPGGRRLVFADFSEVDPGHPVVEKFEEQLLRTLPTGPELEGENLIEL